MDVNLYLGTLFNDWYFLSLLHSVKYIILDVRKTNEDERRIV